MKRIEDLHPLAISESLIATFKGRRTGPFGYRRRFRHETLGLRSPGATPTLPTEQGLFRFRSAADIAAGRTWNVPTVLSPDEGQGQCSRAKFSRGQASSLFSIEQSSRKA